MSAVPTRHLGSVLGLAALLVVGGVSAIAVGDAFGTAGASPAHAATSSLRTLPGATLVTSGPAGTKGPDDLAWLPLAKGSAPLLWTAYQNGIGTTGAPGSTGGPYQSTITGFDLTNGSVQRTINVTGKVDGLGADSQAGRLLATVNEDGNSSLYVIDPSTGTAAHFLYTPNVTVSGNGGTDSVSVWHGSIYLSHSNPNDTSQATQYRVSLDWSTGTALLTPLFYDDSPAQNAVTGTVAPMALTDPDTNFVMPHSSPRFGGDLATISQGDGKILFAGLDGGHLHLTVLNLTDNVSGNLPPIDGIAVATASEGTLFSVDAGPGTISALVTDGFSKGTVFVSEPSDNGNPLLGVLDLFTGHITPLGNHVVSAKGLLFVPEHDGHRYPGGGEGHGHGHDESQGRGRDGTPARFD